MTADTDHPRWWFALRGFLVFFVGSGVGSLVYEMTEHRSVASLPWGWMLFGATVAAALSGLFPRRRR